MTSNYEKLLNFVSKIAKRHACEECGDIYQPYGSNDPADIEQWDVRSCRTITSNVQLGKRYRVAAYYPPVSCKGGGQILLLDKPLLFEASKFKLARNQEDPIEAIDAHDT